MYVRDTSATESDVEDGPESNIEMSKVRKGKPSTIQMSVRLKELGPRMQLKLMKIHSSFCDGDILYRDGTLVFSSFLW
jgi:hypothetical protein